MALKKIRGGQRLGPEKSRCRRLELGYLGEKWSHLGPLALENTCQDPPFCGEVGVAFVKWDMILGGQTARPLQLRMPVDPTPTITL